MKLTIYKRKDDAPCHPPETPQVRVKGNPKHYSLQFEKEGLELSEVEQVVLKWLEINYG